MFIDALKKTSVEEDLQLVKIAETIENIATKKQQESTKVLHIHIKLLYYI